MKQHLNSKKQILLFLICYFLIFTIAFAQTFDVGLSKYAFDGEINAITKDNVGNTYIGGYFTSVSLFSGHGVQFNGNTGVQNSDFAKVGGGDIRAVVAIPSGGWYIGGTFTTVNGISRTRLARINSDGSLHPFNPNINDIVRTLEINGSNLYVGGNFTTVNGITRNLLCQFDDLGNLTTFNPIIEGIIYTSFGSILYPFVSTLVHDGNNLYVGGFFKTVGSITRKNLCKFDASGILTSFDPNIAGTVYALEHDGSNLYVGGQFLNSNGISRNCLCKFDASGNLTTFNPNFTSITSASAHVYALVLKGGNLYVGGSFDKVGSISRGNLCKFNASGSLTTFDPIVGGVVRALAQDNINLYVGGTYTAIGNITVVRNRLCKFDASDNLTTFDPNMNDGVVLALACNGSNLYVGGTYTTIGNSTVVRNRLCKFDASGNLTTFSPNIENIYTFPAVHTLKHDGNSLYVGGDFTTVNGTTRFGLCQFDASENLTTFNPSMGGVVRSLALDSGNLYVGGEFTVVGSTDRNNLCKFNALGGLTSFAPKMSGPVYALEHDGNNLYVGGNFLTVNDTTIRLNLCKFDALGNLTSFNPAMGGAVFALAHDGSNLYVGGSFLSTTSSNTIRFHLCKFDALGNLTSFDPNIGSNNNTDVVYALAYDGSNLYVGGRFQTASSILRKNLCKFDASGNLTDFSSNMNNYVRALLHSDSKLFVGGFFTLASPRLAIYKDAAVALPVKILSFSGKNTESGNLLTWRTASESQNKGFDIEVSNDAVRFDKIGFVLGNGTTSQQQDYSFEHFFPFEKSGEVLYYRLKQIDNDGRYEYSKNIAITGKNNTKLHIFPNPSNGIFTIIGIEDSKNETLTVTNSIGQFLSVTFQNDNQLDLSAYPLGVYYLKVASSGQVIKLVKE